MDTSGISFTALYTGHVWYKNGMSARFFTSPRGDLMYRALEPLNVIGSNLLGMNLPDMLLQRHLLIDHRIEQLVKNEGVSQILEIACGLSPRGYKMSRRFPGLHYVEADLPDMARRKQALLLKHKGFGPNHKVVNCNILESGAPQGLDYVMQEVLDPARPTIIITEGLVNYFDLKTIAGFWRRLAQLGQGFPSAWYLTDLATELSGPVQRPLIAAARKVLGVATKASVSLHFRNSQDAADHFREYGFSEVQVHKPEQFYEALALPVSPRGSYIRVVEAKV